MGNHYRQYREKYVPRGTRVYVSRDSYVVHFTSRTGYCLACLTGRFASSTVDEQLDELWSVIHGGAMQRKNLRGSSLNDSHARADDIAKLWPRLVEFMTAAKFEGSDEPRAAPTLTIWAQGGVWRCTVRDRAEGLVLWLSDEKLDDLLSLADAFCQDAEGPWRHDEVQNGKSNVRVKHRS